MARPDPGAPDPGAPEISQTFTLEPGDAIFTGTPAGVGPLNSGDKFTARLGNIIQVFGSVA